MKYNKIVLASQSPRRGQLLEWAEIPFEVVIADIDETYPNNLPPSEIAMHIAQNKAFAVQKKIKNTLPTGDVYPILAADTIVVLNGQIIGKPASRAAAVETLSMLSGNTHSVITGVCIVFGSKTVLFANETSVQFLLLSKEQIEYYVDTYKPYDKAGAYAIQEWIGVTGIHSIQGDFYNVMGLPVSRVIKELKALG
jgi:septum formation protein